MQDRGLLFLLLLAGLTSALGQYTSNVFPLPGYVEDANHYTVLHGIAGYVGPGVCDVTLDCTTMNPKPLPPQPVTPCSHFSYMDSSGVSHSGCRPKQICRRDAGGSTIIGEKGDRTVVLPSNDLCCARGWSGNHCQGYYLGCDLNAANPCDNGGYQCIQNTPTFSSCVPCPSGYTGDFCETRILSNPPDIRTTKKLGRVLYGPGVEGITVSPSSRCGVDFTCQLHDPYAACSSMNTCVCDDQCTTGRACTQRTNTQVQLTYLRSDSTWVSIPIQCPALDEKMVQNALVEGNDGKLPLHVPYTPCSLFGSYGCPTNMKCVRQATGSTRVVQNGAVSVTVAASDVCCERNYNGQECDTFTGCSIGGCDNGGNCSTGAQSCVCPAGFSGFNCEIPDSPCIMSAWNNAPIQGSTMVSQCNSTCGAGWLQESRFVIKEAVGTTFPACRTDLVRYVPCARPPCTAVFTCMGSGNDRDMCITADADRRTKSTGLQVRLLRAKFTSVCIKGVS